MTTVPPGIKVRMILCDAAQADAATGKLHMLGAGWTWITTPLPPHAVAVMVQVPWDRTNERMALELDLLTADGVPVVQPGPTGPDPVRVRAEMEAGRPAGIDRGSPISLVFAVNVGPLQLLPGRHEWRATIDGQTFAESFQVVARPPGVIGSG